MENVYRKLEFTITPPAIADYFRVGRKTADKPSPIKVKSEHLTDAIVLKKSSKRKSTDLMSVYLSPDRNKQSTTKMGTMIKEDPIKFYFIRSQSELY